MQFNGMIKISLGVLIFVVLAHNSSARTVTRTRRVVSLDLADFEDKPYIKRVELALQRWGKTSKRCPGDLEIWHKEACYFLVTPGETEACSVAGEWLVLKKPRDEGRHFQVRAVCAEMKCADPEVSFQP